MQNVIVLHDIENSDEGNLCMFCADIVSLSNTSGPRLVILFDVEPTTPGLNSLFVITNILVLGVLCGLTLWGSM